MIQRQLVELYFTRPAPVNSSVVVEQRFRLHNGTPSEALERTAHHHGHYQRRSGRMAFVCRCTKHPKPTWPRVLVCSIACLPDERHITGPRSGIAIVDTDRVYAGGLDVHRVASVDVHDVGSR